MRPKRLKLVVAGLGAAVVLGGIVAVSETGGTSTQASEPTDQSSAAAPNARPNKLTESDGASTSFKVEDPATWSNAQLARQLTFTGVDPQNIAALRRAATAGIGGITFMGESGDAKSLASNTTAAKAGAPHGLQPMISSDEEGGNVQHLRNVIYPIPSAKTMGTWPVGKIRTTATDYGQRMHDLGLAMDFGPDADLSFPGYFIDQEHRAFSANPQTVAQAVGAWASGLQAAQIIPVIKHWPGHGEATNTHKGAAKIAPLATLENRDMIPFEAQFKIGVPAVMVGHLRVQGLTTGKVPTSMSPEALSYLRAHAGPDAVIITDSLSMGASSTALHINPPQSAVRALAAGADWALVCSWDPIKVAAAIQKAITTGVLPREQAIESAKRILELKKMAGLLPADSAR